MQDRTGRPVPEVTFPVRVGNQWSKITSREIFANRKVIVFSLPGAFTPTCSSTHLPRYDELAPVFFDEGIDSIICVSVNDTFVMDAWKGDQETENVYFLPDGNGEFTEGMGMLVDKRELGFGKRSWRYSMLVSDGIIEKMFIEPDVPGDPFEVSDADTMLAYINPGVRIPGAVTVFTKPGCSFCAGTKSLLEQNNIRYHEIQVGPDIKTPALRAITGEASVPQVFVEGKWIGGSEAVATWLAKSRAA